MGSRKGISSVHHSSTDHDSAVAWRIAELNSDVESLLLYSHVATNKKAKKAFKFLITLCNAAIDKLQEEL